MQFQMISEENTKMISEGNTHENEKSEFQKAFGRTTSFI